jgi:hypothetical protein
MVIAVIQPALKVGTIGIGDPVILIVDTTATPAHRRVAEPPVLLGRPDQYFLSVHKELQTNYQLLVT